VAGASLKRQAPAARKTHRVHEPWLKASFTTAASVWSASCLLSLQRVSPRWYRAAGLGLLRRRWKCRGPWADRRYLVFEANVFRPSSILLLEMIVHFLQIVDGNGNCLAPRTIRFLGAGNDSGDFLVGVGSSAGAGDHVARSESALLAIGNDGEIAGDDEGGVSGIERGGDFHRCWQ